MLIPIPYSLSYCYNPFYFDSYYASRMGTFSEAWRPLPPVNPSILMSSAKHMMKLLTDVRKLTEHLAGSTVFSSDVMSAAQASNQTKVMALLKGVGISSISEIHYTPDGLLITFKDHTDSTDCCHLNVFLKWR